LYAVTFSAHQILRHLITKAIFGSKSAPLYRHWGSVQAVRPIGRAEV